jgi:hypothetical protein
MLVVSTKCKLSYIVLAYEIAYFSKAVSYANVMFITVALGIIALFWQAILP